MIKRFITWLYNKVHTMTKEEARQAYIDTHGVELRFIQQVYDVFKRNGQEQEQSIVKDTMSMLHLPLDE